MPNHQRWRNSLGLAHLVQAMGIIMQHNFVAAGACAKRMHLAVEQYAREQKLEGRSPGIAGRLGGCAAEHPAVFQKLDAHGRLTRADPALHDPLGDLLDSAFENRHIILPVALDSSTPSFWAKAVSTAWARTCCPISKESSSRTSFCPFSDRRFHSPSSWYSRIISAANCWGSSATRTLVSCARLVPSTPIGVETTGMP